MKIATFNINNINKRLGNLLAWLNEANPDVVCLQELKTVDADFPLAALGAAGYRAVFKGEKSWNGVAILARGVQPILTRTELPGDPTDKQSRYIEAAVRGVLIASLYAPNGNPQPGPKFAYKLRWMERLLEHASALRAADVPVVLAGDYNVVPTDFDIYPTSSYQKNALVQPEPRALFERLLKQNWIDAIRVRHPDAPMYTFWDYLHNRWPRDAGLRIDHLLLSPHCAERLSDAGVDRAPRGADNASDHAPAWIVLGDQAGSIAKRQTGHAKKAVGRASLLAIDGDNFAHRAYHALPKTILMRGGEPAGAILGFANKLIQLHQQEKPRTVLVAWDTLEVPTGRHRQFPAYQSGRTFDEALVKQLARLPELVTAFGFANAKTAGYEADDFLAAAAKAEERQGRRTLIASGDRDTYQLASDSTTILFPVRGGKMLRIGPDAVRERYGVEPQQVPDFIALRGDPSDKLPGAPGIGPAGAAMLVRKYGSIEALLDAGRFSSEADALRLFKSIATMDANAPLPALPDQAPDWANAAKLARAWELKQLAERLEHLAEDHG